MAEGFTSYSVDNDRAFRNAVDEARKQVGDLIVPLTLISRDWYRSERAIFTLKGPGQYPDLAPSTKRQKMAKGKSVYPILRDTGHLESSLLNPNDPNAIQLIANKSTLIIGTRLNYLAYHQSDGARNKLPLRKALFIGPEAKQFNVGDQVGRLDRWMKILKDYVTQKSEIMGEST